MGEIFEMNKKSAIKQLNIMKAKGKKMRLAAEKWPDRWRTLISIILSARTRDETTIYVAKRLFEKYNSLTNLANASLKSVKKIIKPINFYKTKAKNIINCSNMIVENYSGKVPEKEEALLQLPGVGRKTLNVFLSEYEKPAIGVDTHVSYISQKLGWTKNKHPNRIEKDLKKLFPKKYWSMVNSTMVRFGKTYTSRIQKDKILEEIKRLK